MLLADKDEDKTLFVKNLPDGCTEDMLREHFPDVEDVRLPVNPDGTPKR